MKNKRFSGVLSGLSLLLAALVAALLFAGCTQMPKPQEEPITTAYLPVATTAEKTAVPQSSEPDTAEATETESDPSGETTASEAPATEEATETSPTAEETTAAPVTESETAAPVTTEETTTEAATEAAIDEDGYYYSKDEVALYLHTYGHLPANFVTKDEARDAGWSGGNVDRYLPGCVIGGDRFGNYEGLLPQKKGLKYYECDIDTLGSSRGAKRIIYSNDGHIYYTDDHYESFTELYSGD